MAWAYDDYNTWSALRLAPAYVTTEVVLDFAVERKWLDALVSWCEL